VRAGERDDVGESVALPPRDRFAALSVGGAGIAQQPQAASRRHGWSSDPDLALVERVTVPLAGEHFLRRPLKQVQARGLDLQQQQRFALGLVERLVARKPTGTTPTE
jgi:hypothetical protein